MKKTYKYRLPSTKKALSAIAEIIDGNLVVEVEFEEYSISPKDGDFLVSNHGNVFIYSSKPSCFNTTYASYCGDIYGDEINLTYSDNWTEKKGCRYATKEEKKQFLNKLRLVYNKKWNPIAKRIEDIYNDEIHYKSKRVNKGEKYYFIENLGDSLVIHSSIDNRNKDDDNRFKVSNYFSKIDLR